MNEELYFENILALLIAIFHHKDTEAAFKYADYLIDNGEIPKHSLKTKMTEEKLEDIHQLRKNNVTWKEIAEIFCLKDAQYLFRKYKEKYK